MNKKLEKKLVVGTMALSGVLMFIVCIVTLIWEK